ncbi:MAG TPA: FeoB-associated Cys-rich membrane protein [Candidatus Eisenbergiella merdipullorum]|uniref:FeoB-associated Cys-rich membrane protein n=1 Tax=Candidatus Eisenbergiella merdipullorum TaxID=2838553 RepID=A0A9D2L021_9FIRM|nr:FeoB-associated Cys-rich membrane protein [Candidatus Eisenbergiella merdipullorum]
MLTFLRENAGTIITALVLAGIVIFVVRVMIRDRKDGKRSCGGNCGACMGCGGGGTVPPAGRKKRSRSGKTDIGPE